MEYKARCYIHFQPEGYSSILLSPSEWSVHRPIAFPVFEADTLRSAKLQATRYCKNNEELLRWYELDPTARWREVLRGILVRKTFKNPPSEADPKERRAIVEISLPKD